MGRESRNFVIELARVQTLDAAADCADGRAGSSLIRTLIEIGPHEGQVFDHRDIRVSVNLAKPRRHEIHEIHVGNVQLGKGAFRGRTQGLRGAYMTGSRGYTQDQDAFALHGDRVKRRPSFRPRKIEAQRNESGTQPS